MAIVLALLLLGAIETKIPTDHDIAARIQTAIVEQLHPASVQVTVQRKSALSTTVEHLDITMEGFKLDSLPLAPAEASQVQPIPGPAHYRGDDPPTPRRQRQIRIKDAHILCKNFELQALPVQELELNARELRIPWDDAQAGNFSIAAAASVTGSILLPQQGLTQFLRSRDLPIDDPTLTFDGDTCRVRGIYHALVSVPVEVSGHLVVKDRAQLCLDDPKLKISSVTVPEMITHRLLKDLNPLTDLNADFPLPAPVTITGLTQTNGCLRLDATLQFPAPE